MSKRTTLCISMAWLVFLGGCAGGNPHVTVAAPAAEPSVSTRVETAREGIPDDGSRAGLYQTAAYNLLFQDLRAYRVGDLVTVNIVETSKATKKAATKTGRDSSINAGINNLLGYEAKMGDYFHLPSAFNNNIMFKASMGNAFDGSGSTSRDESMTAAITARVTETLPNGNLHIKGTREIKVNNEVQFITLSGFIRPNDISPDNTILSSYVADAKIEYTGQGPVSDKQRPGWLGRALDFLWPF